MNFTETENRIEYNDLRFYKAKNGDYYPSVTTVLSCYPKEPFYYEWLKNNGQNAEIIRDKAAEVGSKVHQAIEQLLKGFKITHSNYTIEEWQLINKAYEFFSRYKFLNIRTEFNVINDKLGLGGTIDFIGTLNDKVYMIDFKTSNYLSDTHFMQLEAYKAMYGGVIDEIAVLHLKADTRTDKDFQGKGWKLCFPDKETDYKELFFITKKLFDHKCKFIKPILASYPKQLGL